MLQALYFCKPFRELLELSAIYYANNALAESSASSAPSNGGPSQAQLEEALSKTPNAGMGKSQSERYREAMTGVSAPATSAGTGTSIIPQAAQQTGEKKPGLLSRKTTTLGPSNTPHVNPTSVQTQAGDGDKHATSPPPAGSSGTAGKKGGLARGLSNAFSSSKRMSMTQVPLANGTTSAPASRPGTAVAPPTSEEASGAQTEAPSRPVTNGFLTALSGTMVTASVGAPVTSSSATLPMSHAAPTASSAATTSLPLNLSTRPDPNATLFTTLRDLFSVITHQPKQNGVVAPQAFITQLKQENELFRSTMHQDAHEFFNYLMNEISEDVSKREAQIAGRTRRQRCLLFSPALTSLLWGRRGQYDHRWRDSKHCSYARYRNGRLFRIMGTRSILGNSDL